MSEKLYGVDQFYPGDFAPILTGVYKDEGHVNEGKEPKEIQRY